MEKFAGISLAAWARDLLKLVAELQGKTSAEAFVEMRRNGPAALSELKKSQCQGWLCSFGVAAYNSTLGFFTGPLQFLPESLRINADCFAKTLLDSQGFMIFQAGFFNSDPHPGNLMLLEDGRLGLIDWGQVKRLSAEERCKLARLFVAIADGDEIQAAHFMRALGMRTTRDLDWTYVRLAQYYLCSWTDAFIEELEGVLQFEENLNKVDRVVKSVGVYHMAFRNQIFQRQSLALLGLLRINSAKSLRPAAVACLKDLKQPVPHTRQTAVTVPGELQRLLPQPGDLQNSLKHVDLQQFEEVPQKRVG